MKGNTQKAVMFSAAGAAVGFGASKLFKVQKKSVMILMIIGLAAVGGVIGYKQA